jgi:hypothetical protein
MPPRQPPTYNELADAFDAALRHSSDLSDRPRALDWATATDVLRRRLQTTRSRAGDWIYDAAAHDDCPLAVIRATGSQVRITRWNPETEKVAEVEIDWPRIVQSHVAFSRAGFLLTTDQVRNAAPRSKPLLWVLRRAELPVIRRIIQTDTDKIEQAQAAQKEATRVEFDRIHGADLAVIRAFLDRVAPPGTPEWLTEDILYTDVTTSPRVADLYGTGGSLTISLRGDLITRFADQLRAQEPPR